MLQTIAYCRQRRVVVLSIVQSTISRSIDTTQYAHRGSARLVICFHELLPFLCCVPTQIRISRLPILAAIPIVFQNVVERRVSSPILNCSALLEEPQRFPASLKFVFGHAAFLRLCATWLLPVIFMSSRAGQPSGAVSILGTNSSQRTTRVIRTFPFARKPRAASLYSMLVVQLFSYGPQDGGRDFVHGPFKSL